MPTLIEGYGMSEIPGALNNPFPGPHKIGSMGRAQTERGGACNQAAVTAGGFAFCQVASTWCAVFFASAICASWSGRFAVSSIT